MDELQQRLRAFAAQREWEQFHTPRNLLLALVGEVGELASVLQWLPDADSRSAFEDPEVQSALQEEVADVFIYLLRFADVCGIDLAEAASRKIDLNETRYPVALTRGNATKYTNLHDPEHPAED